MQTLKLLAVFGSISNTRDKQWPARATIQIFTKIKLNQYSQK